jgi:zinc protease
MLAIVLAALLQDELKPTARLQGIEEYRLPNGLRIVLMPDSTKPTFTVNLTVLVGSIHEGAGENGMAHVFEHILFHSAEGFPDITTTLKDLGANYNGSTSFERTNYFETCRATDENLETAIRLEAARLGRAELKADDLAKESKIVENEFDIGESNPVGLLYKALLGAMYDFHAYARSPIGTLEDFRALKIEKIRAFYKKYYRPDTAVLFLTGKFDRARALALVQKHFGDLKGTGEGRPAYTSREPAARGERRATVRKNGSSFYIAVAYRIPGSSAYDSVVASVLAGMLARHKAGPMHEALVGKGLAAMLEVGSLDLQSTSPFLALAMVPKDKDPQAAETAIVEHFESRIDALTQEDLDRAKGSLDRDFDELMNDPEALGRQLSEFEAAGSWKLLLIRRELAKKVTLDEVKKFAARFLRRENRVVGRFEPDEKAAAVQPDPEPALDSYADLMSKISPTSKSVKEFAYTPENLQASLKWVEVGPAKAGLISKEVKGDDVYIEIRIPFAGRAAVRPLLAAGEALASIMTERTAELDKAAVAKKLAEAKATIDVDVELDGAAVSIKAKTSTIREVMALATSMVRAPHVTPEQLKEHVGRTEGQIKSRLDNPMMLVMEEVPKMLFPESDPRRPLSHEQKLEALGRLTVEDLTKFHKEFFGAGGMLVGVVGGLAAEDVRALLEPLVKGWAAAQPFKVERAAAVDRVTAAKSVVPTPGKPAAFSILVQPFRMETTSPEHAALDAATWALFQDPLASRIPKKVREQKALSYMTGGQLVLRASGDLGIVLIFTQTKPESADQALALIREEVDRALKDGITAEEVQSFIKAYRNRVAQMRSRDPAIASAVVELHRWGLDFNTWAKRDSAVDALSPDAVNAALRAHLKPDAAGLIQIGDFK